MRIDCDTHIYGPQLSELVPFMEPFWGNAVEERGIRHLESASYPSGAPIVCRPDWRDVDGTPPSETAEVARRVFGELSADRAIVSSLLGVQLPFAEDMATAFTRALNDWMRACVLDADNRFFGTVVLPIQNVEASIEEIRRFSSDRRFVQAMVLAMGEAPLGRRIFWPIYEEAQRCGMTIAVHAGSSYRHPVTSIGWPSYYVEDYVAQAQGFQSQLASLVSEGVLQEFPDLKFVFCELGVTWLFGFLSRFEKFWKGLRAEVPWVSIPPGDLTRHCVRFTLQPFNVPRDTGVALEMLGYLEARETLLYSSDFPHWHFDGTDPFPPGMPDDLKDRISHANVLETYPRIRQCLGQTETKREAVTG